MSEMEKSRYNYSLNEDSVVFDIGGYHGDFADKIFSKFGCNVYVFEPIKSYFEKIHNRFKDNKKVNVKNYGLSNGNFITDITLDGDSSSVFKNNKKKESINLYDVVDTIKTLEVNQIDLMKINVEGSEYNILRRLINSGTIKKCLNLQIQFHAFVNNSEQLRTYIVKDLERTHIRTWNYDWIWENWSRKSV